jgi:polyisoprenoid-binding protein YceI
VQGELTIHGITRTVTLDVTFEGLADPDPFGVGSQRAGFSAETTLSRKEFGMTYSPVLETGGVAVGDKVKVAIHFEAVRQG